jgi:hypothetical protein
LDSQLIHFGYPAFPVPGVLIIDHIGAQRTGTKPTSKIRQTGG